MADEDFEIETGGETETDTPVEEPVTEPEPEPEPVVKPKRGTKSTSLKAPLRNAGSDSVTATIVKPISGGGFGDCKVALVTFTGDKDDADKGYLSPFKQAPIFVFADNGAVSYADGYVNVTAGGTVAFIFKG